MVKYRTYELTLKKGAKLFLYTDGVVEATNAHEELFGTERMCEALHRAENGTPQFDDLTMLCLEYKGTEVG